MRYLPVMLDLAGRRILVVGGGRVATRKVARLLDSGASVRVVSPEVSPELEAIAARTDRLELSLRPFDPSDLDGIQLVFTATGVESVEQIVHDEGDRRGVWVNAADDPERCSFLMPATLERGSLQVAVSTGGESPVLAGRVRDEIDAALGPEYADAVAILGRLRRELPPGEERSRAFSDLVDGGLLEALRQGDDARVERMTSAAKRSVHGASQGGEG